MSIEQTIGNKTFEVTKELIDSLTILIDEKKVGEINIALNALHPSDAAELLSNLPEQSRSDLFLLETIELKAILLSTFYFKAGFFYRSDLQSL